MISSDVIRGYNDIIILAILAEDASYGYEISKTIRLRSHDQYIIKETTLYSAFNRLEKNGYIRPFQKEAGDESRRTYYEITPAGQVYLDEKKTEWVTTQQVINTFIK
ncbi:MAG: PadR family transcriptional regulator [Acholeplasmataceae bacterium]|nr:MAG: PadR family transcriptional regulator [Acholeplasmataceae bacterium]